jgi:hypothetical protein
LANCALSVLPAAPVSHSGLSSASASLARQKGSATTAIEPMHFSVDGDGDHGDTCGAVFARGDRPAPGILTRRIVL